MQILPDDFQKENLHFSHIHSKSDTAHWTEAPCVCKQI